MTEQQKPTYLIDSVGSDFQKPVVALIGEDGNVFSIIGRVQRALHAVARVDLGREFAARAMSGDYSYEQIIGDLFFQYCELADDADDRRENAAHDGEDFDEPEMSVEERLHALGY